MRTGSDLLLLPETVLERILLAAGRKRELRRVCKAFSFAITKSLVELAVPRGVLRNGNALYRTLAAFPNAQRVVLDLSHRSIIPEVEDDYEQPNFGNDDAALVTGALDTLAARRHPLKSLEVLHLSCSLPLPSATTLDYLTSCGLTELHLQDVSIQRAASDGASNLLRAHPPALAGYLSGQPLADSIRTRGAAMIRFACSLPSLRRLSLCNAAFSAYDMASLASLTQLEELYLVGAMECWAAQCPEAAHPPRPKQLDASAAVPAYKHLLSALPLLRRLCLPMAISAPGSGATRASPLDSDDEEEDDIGNDATGGGDVVRCYWAFQSSSEARWRSRPSDSRSDVSNCAGAWAVPGQCCPVSYEVGRGHLLSVVRAGCATATASATAAGGRAEQLPQAAAATAAQPAACSYADAAGGWAFPPYLQELTIPLCSLNGPVFRAACDAYGVEPADCTAASEYGGGDADAGAGVVKQPHHCLRAMHISCSPGYTVWEGSFLTTERDFAALSRLSPSLERLHLCLELEGSGRSALRRDRLRGCLAQLRTLRRIKELHIRETHRPVCFAAQKAAVWKPDVLSYLLDETAEPPRPWAGVRLPAMPRLGDTSPFTPPRLRGARALFADGEAAPPPLLPLQLLPPVASICSVSSSSFTSSSSTFASSPSSTSSTSSTSPGSGLRGSPLDLLLVHWPQLQSLVVCGQRAVRCSRGGQARLVMAESVQEGVVEAEGELGMVGTRTRAAGRHLGCGR